MSSRCYVKWVWCYVKLTAGAGVSTSSSGCRGSVSRGLRPSFPARLDPLLLPTVPGGSRPRQAAAQVGLGAPFPF